MRRLAIGCGVVATLVILALGWLPSFFEDRVAAAIRSELDARLNADIDFAEIDLSLLSTFPRLTATVRDLRVSGTDAFDGVPLVTATSVAAAVDLWSLVADDHLAIEAVRIDSPQVTVVVREDGLANYDIVVEASPAPQGEPLVFRVNDYGIRNGTITYDTSDISVRITGLEHDGSASVDPSAQQLESRTRAEALTIVVGSRPMVRDARAEIDVDATLMADATKIVLEALRLQLNALSLEATGAVARSGEAIDLDIEIDSGERQSVAALLSLLPAARGGDLRDVNASGRFSLDGRIHGRLGPAADEIPAFSARLDVDDGSLQYPDLPRALEDIEIDARATHPGGNLDRVTLDVEKLGVVAGSSRVTGSLRVRRPISRPDVELSLRGRVDAEDLRAAYPLEEVEEVEALEGIATTSIDLSVRGDDIERLAGDLEIEGLVYRKADTPAVRVSGARILFTPDATKITALSATFGASDAQITGSLSPLTRFFQGEDVGGQLELASNRIVVDELVAPSTTSTKEGGETTRFLLPDGVDASLALRVGEVVYDDLLLSSIRGAARLRDRTLTLKDVRATAIGGRMQISGAIATPIGRPATFDLRYAIERASFAKAFESLSSLRAFAPVARFIDGRFSAELDSTGQLAKDGAPELDTIDATGMVVALQGKVDSDFPPLVALSRAIPAVPRPISVGRVQTRFRLEDGAVEVRPFDLRTGGPVLNVRGRHGLDREMDYRIRTQLSISQLTEALERRVRELGIDLSKTSAIDVAARLTGTASQPNLSLDVDADALRATIADAVSQEVEQRRQEALELLSAQNARALAEARKRAEQIRDGASRAADRIRREGNARADQLVDEASGNRLAEIAAKEAALRLRRESEERATQLEQEADERAKKLLTEAETRAEDLLDGIDDPSKGVSDAATRQTTQ